MHDPVAVFQQALACLQVDDFAGAAACCDPVSLRSFQRQMLLQYVPEEPVRPTTIDDMLRSAPDMPREVAAYHVRQQHEWAEQRKDVSRELPGIADVAALEAATGAAVFAAYLMGKSDRFQLRRYVDAGELTEADVAATAAMSRHFHALHVIGVIKVTDRLAHLFFAREMMEQPESDHPWAQRERARIAAWPADERELLDEMKGHHAPESVMCRQQPDGSWRLLASHMFLGAGGAVFITRQEPADDSPPDPDHGVRVEEL